MRRELYAGLGIGLAMVKYAIDMNIAARYGVRWLPYNYWVMPSESSLGELATDALRPMYLTMLWATVPFVLVGVALTYLRLRRVGLHGAWVLLFFRAAAECVAVPVVVLAARPQRRA